MTLAAGSNGKLSHGERFSEDLVDRQTDAIKGNGRGTISLF